MELMYGRGIPSPLRLWRSISCKTAVGIMLAESPYAEIAASGINFSTASLTVVLLSVMA